MAELIQNRFEVELRKLEYWAAMPMVIGIARENNNMELLSAFEEYFSAVVAREPYSSIYLINRIGECVASDDPHRLYQPYCRNVVGKRPCALAGFAGKANIGYSVMSVNGRPTVPLTVPVWNKGRVTAILRAGVDMGLLGRELTASLSTGRRVRLYIFDPSLPKSRPKGLQLNALLALPPYVPPPDALRTALRKAPRSLFQYRDRNGEYVVASARMQQPPLVIVAEQPMSQVPAPIRPVVSESGSDPDSRGRLGIDDAIFVQSGRQRIRLPLRKVCAIQAEGDFTALQSIDGASGTVWRSLSEWENVLPEGRFVRINRGMIVNLEYIQSFETTPGNRLLLQLMGTGAACHASRRLTPLLRIRLQDQRQSPQP